MGDKARANATAKRSGSGTFAAGVSKMEIGRRLAYRIKTQFVHLSKFLYGRSFGDTDSPQAVKRAKVPLGKDMNEFYLRAGQCLAGEWLKQVAELVV